MNAFANSSRGFQVTTRTINLVPLCGMGKGLYLCVTIGASQERVNRTGQVLFSVAARTLRHRLS